MAERRRVAPRSRPRRGAEDGRARAPSWSTSAPTTSGRRATCPGAVHIELPELASRVDEIDRDRPVIFYCRSDNRSDMAAAAWARPATTR